MSKLWLNLGMFLVSYEPLEAFAPLLEYFDE